MGPGRSVALLALALLFVAPEAEARLRKKQAKPTPPPVVVDSSADPEEVREAEIEARRRGTRVVVRELPAIGPSPRRSPGPTEADVTTPTGTAFVPKDRAITDASFDGFPANTHTEPSLAAQGDDVVCVFNDGGLDALSPHPAASLAANSDGYALSSDGGATFQDQGKRNPANGYSFSGDNVVAAGPDGDFYYLSDGGIGNASYSAMAVSRSTDGGRTWSAPSNAAAGVSHRYADGFFDKGWIAVDRSSGPTRGTVYVTWSDFSFSAVATDLHVARSTDRGLTWKATKLDAFSHPVAVTYVQTASNGWVFVGEQDEGSFVDGAMTGTNYVRVSTDGGATWSSLRSAGRYRSVGDAKAIAQCGDPGFFGGLVRYLNGPIEADSSLRIAVDPSDATGQTVLIATQAVPDAGGDASDVFVWRSTDAGRTFAAPVRVNDDRGANDQFMPDLWFAPDGTLAVLWLDRRNDRANWRLEAWAALSTDGGRTFGCNFPVSARAFPPIGRCQMSDYNGVYADGAKVYLAWGDGRQVDSQAQTTYAVYGTTIPLEGPGPVLRLDGFTPPASGTQGAFLVRVRNDGTAPATSLQASLTVDGNQILAPTLVYPFPDVPACHGLAELALQVPFAVTTPYVGATLHLSGGAGAVDLPFAFPRPQGGKLGTLLSGTFESGAPNDFTPDAGSLWHATSACAALGAGHEGASVAYFGLDATCTYDLGTPSPARVYGGLVSRKIALPPGGATLAFDEWVGRSAFWNADYMGAQISTDGGASFENLWGYGRMSRFTPDPAVPLADGSGRPKWHRVSLDLSGYGGHEVVVRFFVNATTRPSGGYAVDDVSLVSTSKLVDAGLGTCAAPIEVDASTLDSLALELSDMNARAASSEPRPPCAASSSHPFWMRVVPPESGDFAFAACGSGFSGSLAVYNASSCASPNAAPVACGAFPPCGGGGASPLVVAAEKGKPLYVLFAADGTSSAGTFTFSVAPHVASRVVPVVLDVVSGFGSYTTELTLTNRTAQDVATTLTYTASLGEGSGSVSGPVVPRGGSIVLPDVLATLRQRGLPIPPSTSGVQAGTLDVAFTGPAAFAADAVSAVARTLSPTKSPLPFGRASLAYAGVAPAAPSSVLVVTGLRTSASDRSKVAVYSRSAEPLTLRITVYDGAGSGRNGALAPALTLPPYGWMQFEDPLSAASTTNGYAVIEKLAGTGAFGAYGVVNDNVTNDGSYIPGEAAARANAVPGVASRLTVPVLVETDRFTSELVLTNRGSRPATLSLSYRESLQTGNAGGSVTLDLPAGVQYLLPDAIDWLRTKGVPVGARGASHAGALRLAITNGLASDVFASARVAAPADGGGEFGLFLPAVRAGEEAVTTAYLDGLFADGENRSNVAVVNAGGDGSGDVTLKLQAIDGMTGAAAGQPLTVTLAPGAWAQPPGFFGEAGVSRGRVVVTRVSGFAPWLAYAVVNDGGLPGSRTDDGAYVAMEKGD